MGGMRTLVLLAQVTSTNLGRSLSTWRKHVLRVGYCTLTASRLCSTAVGPNLLRCMVAFGRKRGIGLRPMAMQLYVIS